MIEEGMRCVSRRACDNGGIGRERIRKKREAIFLMEDFPPSPNLVRKLIKFSGSKVALYLYLSLSLYPFPLSLFVCVLPALMSVFCLLSEQSIISLKTSLNTTITAPAVGENDVAPFFFNLTSS